MTRKDAAKTRPAQISITRLYEQRLRETVDDIIVMLEFARQRGMSIPPDLANSITELLRRPELGGPIDRNELTAPTQNADDLSVIPASN